MPSNMPTDLSLLIHMRTKRYFYRFAKVTRLCSDEENDDYHHQSLLSSLHDGDVHDVIIISIFFTNIIIMRLC